MRIWSLKTNFCIIYYEYNFNNTNFAIIFEDYFI